MQIFKETVASKRTLNHLSIPQKSSACLECDMTSMTSYKKAKFHDLLIFSPFIYLRGETLYADSQTKEFR